MIDLTIERVSFFQAPKGRSLRLREHAGAPPPEHNRHDCNCTKTVTTRPEGKPHQVSQTVVYRSQRDVGALEVKLGESFRHSGGLCWTFTWGESTDPGHGTGHQPHAYFWATGLEHEAMIEVVNRVRPWKDFGNRDAGESIGARLFMGREIDTSEFFNGHSPSQVVDLADIGEREVWMHYRIGHESMKRVAEGPEADRWREVFDTTSWIAKRVERYWSLTCPPADSVHALVATDELLASRVELVSGWIEDFVKQAPKTQVGQWSMDRDRKWGLAT